MTYDRHEAAEIVGLSPITLSNHTRAGYSDLVRRLDYFVRYWEQGGLITGARLFFTERAYSDLR
jgi:hypothetical protein